MAKKWGMNPGKTQLDGRYNKIELEEARDDSGTQGENCELT